MTSQIPCPNCNQPVDSQARKCPSCGVDLAIAAVLAEREILPVRLLPGLAVTPEILVPRLGEYLVEKGKITPADLEHALNYQKIKSASGKPILLGQALRELQMLDAQELDEAITEQILTLQLALKRTNQELETRVRERTIDLQLAIEKLSELNQLKANFIANVSHELRTPLTHIKGYLELLSGGDLGPMSERQVDALNVMERSESRLEGLIEDLIQFSLVSRGELALNQARVDLEVLLKSVLGQSAQKASSFSVSLELAMPSQLPRVLCDADKISWVLAQLLDNASKFTPKGGSIKLEARQSDNFVKISVADSGIGIPKDRLQEIFEPFHQLDSSPTRRYGGTGLGLALCQRILKAHASVLDVHSIEGQGSRFEFLLPISENEV